MNAAFIKIKPCVAVGQGVHSWVFHAACKAIEAGMSGEQAVQAIDLPKVLNALDKFEINEVGRDR